MRHEHMYPDGKMGPGTRYRMDKGTYSLYVEWIKKMRHIEWIACELQTCDPGYTPKRLFAQTGPYTPDWYHYDSYCLHVNDGSSIPLVISFPSMGTMPEPSHYQEIAHVPKYCMKMLEGRYSRWKSCIELGRMVIEKAYKERGREDELKQKHEKWFNSLLGLATLGREVAPIPEPYTKRLHIQTWYAPHPWSEPTPDAIIHGWVSVF